MKYKTSTFTLSILIALSGCGGANEDWASKDPSALAASANTFNLANAWTNFNEIPYALRMHVSGSCEGNFSISTTATAVSSQYPDYNLKNLTTYARKLSRCKEPFTNKDGEKNYSSMNFYKLQNGQLQNGFYEYLTDYGKVWSGTSVWRAPAQFPASAKVGNAGLIGLIDNYVYSYSEGAYKKVGLEEWRYVIEERTASTVFFNLIVTAYDTTTSTTPTDYLSAPVVQTEKYKYIVYPRDIISLMTYEFTQKDGFNIYAEVTLQRP